jgi:hypothetical protein
MGCVRVTLIYSLLLGIFLLGAPLARAQATPAASTAAPLSEHPSALAAPAALLTAPAPPAQLQLSRPALADSPVSPSKKGSLAAEVSSSLLGELLGMGVSFAFVLPIACIDCGDFGPRDESASMRAAIAVGHIARPAIVGGFTALGGRLSGGEGKVGMAMVGAIPGTLVTGLSWMLASEDAELAPFAVLQGVGHVLTIAGSVAAYRYSSRFVVSERMARFLRYAPSPMIDRQRGIAGLSLSGSF